MRDLTSVVVAGLPCASNVRSLRTYNATDFIVRSLLFFISSFTVWMIEIPRVAAADLSETQALFYAGEYDKCIEQSRAEVDRGVWNDGWSKLLIRSLLVKGEYEQAAEVYKATSAKFSSSLSLRLLGAEALRYSGKDAEGKALLDQIPDLLQTASWRYSDRENLIAIGQYFASVGEDARDVLAVYDRVLKSDSKYIDANVATAELALSKNDYQEAVKSLKVAVGLRPGDPHIHYLTARAWAPSDGEKADAALTEALKINPRHIDSLIMQAESVLDGEQFDPASALLDKIEEINPKHPKSLALRAVMAHLRGLYREEGEFRSRALATWPTNPAVDYEIGRKLSRFYRFAEAVKYQRRALKLDPTYVPARFQLAQDLLRTGAVEEGWMIVEEVAKADKYNVVASNLRTLRNRLDQFATLEAPGFVVRMDARESRIYGARVINLLTEAKRVLCEKYGMDIQEPVFVEIFPQQSDFAIRTFGLPGGAGFLGVCFGKLITANSPASQGDSPSNWESVLWHEFCHVVTLQKTNNRMPRWLSEGISVYEELERDRSWGQSLTPTYRKMLLGEDFVPLSRLSSAFLSPKSGMHLQFAYFESSLAVRYMVERHGMERLKKLLTDLGVGVPMEEALARNYGDRDVLDADFKKYVDEACTKLFHAEKLDETELPEGATLDDLRAFVKEHRSNYEAGMALSAKLINAAQWEEADKVLAELDRLWPEDADAGGILDLAAHVKRQLEDSPGELELLKRINRLSSDSVDVMIRLLSYYEKAEDWAGVSELSAKLLAVQPLIEAGHRARALAGEKLNRPSDVADAYAAMLELEPVDPGQLRYRLAAARLEAGDLEAAETEVITVLEEFPRYRDAQRLLLKIESARSPSAKLDLDRAALPDTEGRPPAPQRVSPENAPTQSGQ
ncbi:MAG: peptidase MA family metallohydrolase [Pirellulales bacterium]